MEFAGLKLRRHDRRSKANDSGFMPDQCESEKVTGEI